MLFYTTETNKKNKKTERWAVTSLSRISKSWSPHMSLLGMLNVAATLGNSLTVPTKSYRVTI